MAGGYVNQGSERIRKGREMRERVKMNEIATRDMKDTMRKNKGECVREMKERVDQVEEGNEMLMRGGEKERRKCI